MVLGTWDVMTSPWIPVLPIANNPYPRASLSLACGQATESLFQVSSLWNGVIFQLGCHEDYWTLTEHLQCNTLPPGTFYPGISAGCMGRAWPICVCFADQIMRQESMKGSLKSPGDWGSSSEKHWLLISGTCFILWTATRLSYLVGAPWSLSWALLQDFQDPLWSDFWEEVSSQQKVIQRPRSSLITQLFPVFP